MTETAPLCTAWPWDAPLARRTSSHGPPVRGREVRICDPEGGAAARAGAEGEICVRGPSLFAYYYKRAPGEALDDEGFFHTGDLGRLDAEGALTFLGRIKDVIKTAGVNVAAAEIEAVLLEVKSSSLAKKGLLDADEFTAIVDRVLPGRTAAATPVMAERMS